jgi:hypothetical protein
VHFCMLFYYSFILVITLHYHFMCGTINLGCWTVIGDPRYPGYKTSTGSVLEPNSFRVQNLNLSSESY